MEPWKRKTTALVVRSKAANALCKKHPKHRQSPGVCSICVSEKLLQLSNSNIGGSSKAAKSPSSSSDLSSLSSSDVSSCSSPLVISTRMESEARRKSMRVFGQNVLKKSRSMAFVLQRTKEEDHNIDDDNGKKISMKKGFWSKLLPRRINKGLMHSRTMRERVIAAVH